MASSYRLDTALKQHLEAKDSENINIEKGTFAGNQYVPSAKRQTPQVSRKKAAEMMNVSERTSYNLPGTI